MRARTVLARCLVCAASCLSVSVAVAQSREARPLRIVSTAPSATESLFALGLGDRVVAVSDFCRYPPQVTSLPKIGTVLRPDFERIVNLRPDLVVIPTDVAGIASRLSAARIPYVDVPTTTLADVTTALVKIGVAAGIEAHARDVANDITARLDRIRQQTPVRGSRPRVLLIVGRDGETLTGMTAAGPGSYLDELIQVAGGVNVLAGAYAVPYPRVSLDAVFSLNPDVILDAIDMSGRLDWQTQRSSTLALWGQHHTISAVRGGRLFTIENGALFTPGPRVVESAEWLHQAITAMLHQ